MSTVITVGCQWGDEGKGKVISAVASQADWVIRHQGGNNAGHTVRLGGEQYIVHLLPTGILFEGVRNLIGAGVVVDPIVLTEEMDELHSRGVEISPARLLVSGRCNLIMPYHKLLDGLEEQRLAGKSVGTTKRGIGPAYMDKVGRRGIKVFELLDTERFRARVATELELKNPLIEEVYQAKPMTVDEIVDEYLPCAERIRDFVCDGVQEASEAMESGARVLFEGAQGTMLDIDYGTYPYLTSSNTIAGGACTGAAAAPTRINGVLGIMKAYTTRVGGGPMPSEADEELANQLRTSGPVGEFGATTGRPRRCGWLDLPVGRFAVRVSGIDGIALTRLDVLGHMSEIQACTAYELNGKQLRYPPADVSQMEACKPVWQSFESWKCDISQVRTYDDLPEQAKTYVSFIEEELGVPVVLISVGPALDETISRLDSIFKLGRS